MLCIVSLAKLPSLLPPLTPFASAAGRASVLPGGGGGSVFGVKRGKDEYLEIYAFFSSAEKLKVLSRESLESPPHALEESWYKIGLP